MKRVLSFSLMLFLAVFLSAAGGSQKYYAVASDEWQSVNQICHYAGVSGPTSNGPVTASQLLLALERAGERIGNDNQLLNEMKAALTDKSAIYSDEIGSISLVGELAPEMYTETSNPHSTAEKDEWGTDSDWFIRKRSERESLFSLILENTVKDNFYGRLKFSFRQKSNPEDEDIWNKNLHFSFIGNVISQNFPFDAGVSLGAEGLSLIVARSRVSLGEGYTGNTAIGDNYDYQDFLKAGFYTKKSSVFLTLTTFDSSHGTDIENPWDVKVSSFGGWKNIRHSAAYEAVLAGTLKVSAALVTLLDTTSSFDIRYLNPFIFLHNMYNFHQGGTEEHKYSTLEANNMVSLDMSWTFMRKWNLYLQVTMDQLQLPGESDEYIKDFDYTEPNTFAGLFNISYTDMIGEGILNLYSEVVYTMPGMYLNSKYYDENGNVIQDKKDSAGNANKSCWSQDFLLGYHRELESADDVCYSGYRYGPDCVTVTLGGTYRDPSLFSVSGAVFYMAHGEKGRGKEGRNYNFDKIDGKEDVNRLGLYGMVEHTLAVKAEGEVQLFPFLSVSLGAAYSVRWNYRNTEGLTFSNLQGYLGVKLSSSSFIVG